MLRFSKKDINQNIHSQRSVKKSCSKHSRRKRVEHSRSRSRSSSTSHGSKRNRSYSSPSTSPERTNTSSYLRGEVFQSILMSVHKERAHYYQPHLDELTEKHYTLMKKSLELGLIPGFSPLQKTLKSIQLSTSSNTTSTEVTGSPQPSEYDVQKLSSSSIENTQSYCPSNQLLDSLKSNRPAGGSQPVKDPQFMEKFRAEFCKDEKISVKAALLDAFSTYEGANYLKKNLPTAPRVEVTMIYNLIINTIYSTSCHSLGNYVVQTVIEYCLPGERSDLFFKLLPEMKILSSNKHGTRVVQCLLQYMEAYQIILLHDVVLANILHFCTHNFAFNIVLRLIEKMLLVHSSMLQKLITSMRENLGALLKDSNSVTLILKILYTCPEELMNPLKLDLLCRIDRNLSIITSSKSYSVVLELYENGKEKEKEKIYKVCQTNVVELSCQPYSSLIIQSIILNGAKEKVSNLIFVLNTPTNLKVLLASQHGIKTIEKMVDVLNIPDLTHLFLFLHALKDGDIPGELVSSLQSSLTTSSRDQNIVDIVAEFLFSGNPLPNFAKFGVGQDKVKGWMMAIFKGQSIEWSVQEMAVFVLSLHEISEDRENPGLGMLKLSMQQFLKSLVDTFGG